MRKFYPHQKSDVPLKFFNSGSAPDDPIVNPANVSARVTNAQPVLLGLTRPA